MIGVSALAMAVVAAAATVAARHPLPGTTALLVAAVALAVGDATMVTVRVGTAGESYSIMEGALILALPLVPWEWLTLAALACALSQLASGRTRVKAGYNLAVSVLGVAAGAAVAHLVAGGAPHLADARGAAAAVAAAAVYWLWSTAAVAAVIAVSSGEPVLRVVSRGRALRYLAVLVNVGVALWAGRVVIRDPLALTILPVVVVLLLWAYRGYVRAVRDRDLWQRLEDAATELRNLDHDRVLQAAATEALTLFGADATEVVLRGRRADDQVRVRRAHRAPAFPSAWSDEVGVRFLSDLEITRLGRDEATVVAVPLPEVGGLVGQLRLCYAGHVRPAPHETQVMRTYAHTVATSLLTAELYQEVSELAQRKLHEADHDHLTGLANRALLIRRAEHAIATVKDHRVIAVALLDLDHFKHVNDTLGHAAGDALLVAVASRLPDLVRSRDTVARLGGDEFAVLLTDLTSADQAERVVADVISAVSEPVTVAGVELSVQASAGIACYPDDALDVHGLLQRADTAMYRAKRARGSLHRYDGEAKPGGGLQRLALGAELRRALACGEFDVHYQPQVEIGTGRVVGCEALVRWRHPDRGLLMPDEFISVVEQSGFVGEFTLHVLDRALGACARWWHDDGASLTVAVNLSARNLLDRAFPDQVAALLDAHGLPANRLVCEITETTMLAELDVVEEVLGDLRAHGVQISIDDFGTGYSSLTFLQRVSVNELKIDRTFVSSVLDSPQAAGLVRATIDLARSFGVRTVAEGAETADVVDALASLGCEVVQGHRFSPPVPAAEVCRLLRSLPVG